MPYNNTACFKAVRCHKLKAQCQNSKCVAVTCPQGERAFCKKQALDGSAGSEKAVNVAAKSDQESVRKKAGSQKTLLTLAAMVSAGAGIYLLATQCNPSPVPKPCALDSPNIDPISGFCTGSETPKNLVGCILGPLALAQAVINYKQAKDMGKREKQFSATGDMIAKSPQNLSLLLDAKGKLRDISIPCPGNPGETCTLTRDGTTIISPDGSETTISSLAANAPTGPEVSRLMMEAYKEQSLLLAEMKKIDPNFDPLDPNNVVTVTTFPDGRRYTTMRSASYPILPPMYDTTTNPTAPFTSDSPVGNQGSNNALYSQFAAGKASDSESQGRMSPQEEEENAAGLKNLYRKYFGSGGANPTTSFAGGSSSRSIPFGDSKIAPASENIFALAQNQYQTLRDRGEFIKGQQGSGNSGGGSSTGSQ